MAVWSNSRRESALRIGRGIFGGYQLADGPLQLDPIQHHVPTAAQTYDADLAAHPHDAETLVPAGVRLLKLQRISYLHSDDLHSALP